MTAKLRLCCFCSSRRSRAGQYGVRGSDEILSPFGGSPRTFSSLRASDSQFGSLGERDAERLVKYDEGIQECSVHSDCPAVSDNSFSRGTKLGSRFVQTSRDSGFLQGSHRMSSSSLTDRLMDSCSLRENDSYVANEEESYTGGESSQWDCSSYYQTEAFRARPSRFVNMDSQSTSDFDSSLLIERSHPGQEVEHMGTESALLSSGWSTIEEALTNSGDEPEACVLRVRSSSSLGSEISVSSNSCESIIICHRDQATELQDAINLALGDANELDENRSKLGADILAALRGMRTGQGGLVRGKWSQRHRAEHEAVPDDSDHKKTVRFREEPETKDQDTSLVSNAKSFLAELQNDLAIWFGTTTQGEVGKDERGTSVGTSIILPIPRHPEVAADEGRQGTIREVLAVGKETLEDLENEKAPSDSQQPKVLPSRLSTPSLGQDRSMSGCDVANGPCWRSEPDERGVPTPRPTSKESKQVSNHCGSKPVVEDDDRSVYDYIKRCAGVKEEHSDSSIIFDTASSLLNTAAKGVHDSAGTLGACTHDAAGCSSISHTSESRGMSWGSSDAGSSIGLLPSHPHFVKVDENQEQVQGHLEGVDMVPAGEETSSTAFDSNTFYECLPNTCLEATAAGPFSLPEAGPPEESNNETSAFQLPALNLDQLGCKRSRSQESIDRFSISPKNWPNIPDLTPRTLQRWELDLKLIWMGEDEDDLVAEVRHGSSSVFGTPRMPPVPEDDEASDSGQCSSPVNMAVASPAPACAADCEAPSCDGEDTRHANLRGMNLRVEDNAGEVVDAADNGVLDIVDRMLLQLNGNTSKAGKAAVGNHDCGGPLVEETSQPDTTNTQERTAEDSLKWKSACRKKAILSSVKSQLEQLKELVTSNVANALPNGTGCEPNRRTELERAILQDVHREVALLEKELTTSSKPQSSVENRILNANAKASNSVCADVTNCSTGKEGLKVLPAEHTKSSSPGTLCGTVEILH